MAVAGQVMAGAGSGRIIGLIGAGHFCSHFYMLLLPPLFPVLRELYGVGYTELGLAITVFSITTGLTQAPVGYLVDRYGARSLLVGGLLLEALAIGLIGVLPSYGALLALMVLAGLANAVYHPADYTILNATVPSERMGRAFSLHTFAGFLGDALAPVTILFLMAVVGWQAGLIACGLLGVGVAGLLYLNSDLLQDASRGGASTGAAPVGWRVLLSLPVLMGLLFFVGIAMAGKGINSFSVAAFTEEGVLSLAEASLVLSAFLFMAPPGVLAGGWIADRVRHHARVVAACFVAVALLFSLVALVDWSLTMLLVLFAVAGFCKGMVAPSRDMMIRAVAPPGATGRVFGFVSTGLNIGGIVAPPAFGYLLDRGEPDMLFLAVAAISLLTVATVLTTGRVGAAGRRT